MLRYWNWDTTAQKQTHQFIPDMQTATLLSQVPTQMTQQVFCHLKRRQREQRVSLAGTTK